MKAYIAIVDIQETEHTERFERMQNEGSGEFQRQSADIVVVLIDRCIQHGNRINVRKILNVKQKVFAPGEAFIKRQSVFFYQTPVVQLVPQHGIVKTPWVLPNASQIGLLIKTV